MLNFKRVLTLDIFDYSGHKICPLYDSRSDVSGQATDVFIIGERNGWKELHFNLQSVIDTENGPEKNFRLDYLKADYSIRAVDETETDWYLISEPKITHSGFSKNISVVAGHVSMLLKQKNLTLVFSDEEGNNVGTPAELLDVILKGTGFYPGKVTTFYEDNGDIKRRSLTCGDKTGSFKMISDMCELFDAKAVYHGESYVPLEEDPGDMADNYKAYCTRTSGGEYVQLTGPAEYTAGTYYRYKVRSVDILPMNPFSIAEPGALPNIYKTNQLIDSGEVIELHYGHALHNVTRTLNTENIVTKLFAYGSYGDKTDGYCSIGECDHTEYTYISTVEIQPGEYGMIYYTDDTGEHHVRFMVSGKPVEIGDTLIFSNLDPASEMYVYNATKEYAYFTDEEYGGTLVNSDGQPNATSEETNMVNFIMDFTYYYNVGLFTEEMLQFLAKAQRQGPDLRAAANEASSAYNDKESQLSEIIGNVDYCKIAVTDGSDLKAPYVNADGYLKINLENDEYTSGIVYRSDYYEREANRFTWRVASKLKPNGDPENDSASAVYIIHNTDPITWDKAYLKTINDIPVYVQKHAYSIGARVHYAGSVYECVADIPANQDSVWTSAHWKLVSDLVPESITLWLDYDAARFNPSTDRIFLFKANTVNGYLGSYEAMDESVINTLRETTKVATAETYTKNGEELIVATEHPTYFIPIPKANGQIDGAALKTALENITVDDKTGYAWCWAYDPDGNEKSQLFFYQTCYDYMPHNMWCPVCFTDEESPIPYPNCYWYDWRTGAAYYAEYKSAIPYEEVQIKYPQLQQTTLTKYPFASLMPENIDSQSTWDHMIKTYSKYCLYLIPENLISQYNNYWLGQYENWKTFAIDNSCDAGYVWTQFNETDTATNAETRLGLNFGAVWAACRQRDRYYQGLYTNYVYSPMDPLPAGNYAFQTPYGNFWVFSTKTPTTEELNFNTSDGYMTQTTSTDGDIVDNTVEVKNVTFDAVKYHPANVMDGITWESNSSLDADGGEITESGMYRSGFAPVYLGLNYIYKGPVDNTKVYFYNEKRRFIGKTNITNSTTTFQIPGESASCGYVRIVTSSNKNRSAQIFYQHYQNSVIQDYHNYIILDCEPDTTTQLKAIPEYVRMMGDLLDELYLDLMPAKTGAQDAVTKLDNDLAVALGDIYREGYWQDANYVDGDEDRLYADALENLQHIAKPEATYDIEFVDPYGSNEDVEYGNDTLIVPWPDLNIAYAVHLVDPEIGINEWAFIDKIEKCYDKPWETTIEINTNLTTIAQHSFADVLENIAGVASKLNAKQTKYDQAVIGTGANGNVTAARLQGQIDANRVYITSSASGWRTDESGNMLFESADGDAAMMLTGRGFSIADSKTDSGEWNWRTFGTGHGFTADEITTGFLSADRIQAGVITVDKLENGIGAAIDLSNNGIIMSVKNSKYDKYNGIAIDEEGIRITTDLAQGVVHVLLTAQPSDWATKYGSYYEYKNGKYTAITGSSAPTFATGKYYKTQTVGESRNIISLSGDGIYLSSGGKMYLESGAGMHIESGAAFTVNSPNFKIDDAGDVTVKGNITVLGGQVKQDLTVDQNVYIVGGIKAGDGTIGGWNITTSRLYSGSGNTYVGLDTDSSNNYAIWAGAATPSSSKFSVKRDGTINATQGLIGGWTITTNRLYSGSGTTYVGLDTDSSNDYAFWAGAAAPGSSKFSVKKNGTINATLGLIGGWTIDSGDLKAGSGTTHVQLSTGANAIWAGADKAVNGTTYAPFCVTQTGVLHASGAIVSGTITATGGKIGGWSIDGNDLEAGSGTTHVQLSTGSYAIWAGADKAVDGTTYAPFSVTQKGVLRASGAIVSGTITAASGKIGGWNIDSTGLLYSSSTGSYYIGLDPRTSTTSYPYAIWAGNSSPASAKFSVKKDGTLKVTGATVSGEINASSGSIGGWTIDTDGNLKSSCVYSEMGGGSGEYYLNLNKVADSGYVIQLAEKPTSGTTSTIFGVSYNGDVSARKITASGGISSTANISAAVDISATRDITAGRDITATGHIYANSGYIMIKPKGARNISRIVFGETENDYPRLVCRKISSSSDKYELVWLYDADQEIQLAHQ